jgi:hypothetical protein
MVLYEDIFIEIEVFLINVRGFQKLQGFLKTFIERWRLFPVM